MTFIVEFHTGKRFIARKVKAANWAEAGEAVRIKYPELYGLHIMDMTSARRAVDRRIQGVVRLQKALAMEPQ